MPSQSYNLIEKPFIKAFSSDGSSQELGIMEIFRQAKIISRIGGDTELQELPLTRLLLAIMYRALDTVDTQGDWETLWQQGIPLDKIENYLSRYENRFDLISQETPFYQIINAVYDKANRQSSNLDILIDHQSLETGKSKFLFSSYTPEGYAKLSFATAARRLVELQAFNTAAKKSTIQGDPRVKKRWYAQPGWLGNQTSVMVLGKNLEQTLLLNFIPYGEFGGDNLRENDLPVWEREQQTAVPEGLHGDMDESRIPTGPTDLYTHQIARVTLRHNGEVVTSSVVGIGDRIFKYNMQHLEKMAAWKEIIRKEDKSTALTPVKLNQNETWKSLNALLGHDERVKSQQTLPGVLQWFSDVKETVKKDVGKVARVIVIEASYGPQDAIIENQTSSLLILPNDIITKRQSSQALETLLAALKLTKSMGFKYKTLYTDLYVAEGKKRKMEKGVSATDLASPHMENFFSNAKPLYTEWAQNLTNDNALDEYIKFAQKIEKLTLDMGNEAVNKASGRAIAGRLEDDKAISAFRALIKFESFVRKEIMGITQPKDSK